MFVRRTILILSLLLCSGPHAWAHGIGVDCEVRPPAQVVIFAHYDGGDPAGAAFIRITDPAGNLVGSGMADEHGEFVFIAEAAMAYVAEATIAGHRAPGCRVSHDTALRGDLPCTSPQSRT